MNTIRSTWLGWGVLCVAGGGSYYFAKNQINASRQARFEEEMKNKSRLAKIESSQARHYDSAPRAKNNHKGLDHAGSPSSEGSEDAAPVGHAPINSEQRIREKSKYEAAEPYRSKKGDRFS